MHPISRPLFALFAAAAVLLALPRLMSGQVDPATRCEVKKLKIAGKFGDCRLKATAKALQRNTFADFSKCDATFDTKWTKAEGGECSTTGDAARVFADIVVHTGDMVLVLDGPRFVDNGNGTISDTHTGLMWEKKNGQADGERNYGDPRDPDNFYRWSSTGTAPDGDAFTSFLALLNNCQSNGSVTTGGFAGRCDWRLPTLDELRSIVSLTNFPTIDPIFGNTARAVHWTSSTNFNDVENAWLVEFYNGTSQTAAKGNFAWVRAVRRDPPVLALD